MKFFTWLAGVLADPADRQGSTQRVCLLLLVLVVCAVLILLSLALSGGKKLDLPPEVSSLVKFLVAALIGGIAWAKGVAGTVAIKGAVLPESES